MLEAQMSTFERRIAQEERLARETPNQDMAIAHHQLAMLYKAELAVERKRRARAVSQTLAEIW
ncbi:hypothetical protein [Novosphingobium sp. JCM 18896]|uniref:hypothetical protein n=1 Tax=Novosphingobium sp. JCM 18896 TaxID=2989731 RepID=UPI0022220992|nr:hypothetical protein [Novosphingobium sp. JCM 18896]MCW1429855.1 hypothetical protein [Novosphingobium sp. JCM 18896]